MRTAKDKKLSVPVRAIHIDLKGMPPKMERLLQLLELYAASSYNAVLVEWEDMFPWQEPLLRSPYAYSKEEINAFAEKAANCRMEIIPLVQSCGHMENLLKHGKYRHLRELEWMNSDMTVSAESKEIICDMYGQVLALLPDVRYFHMGGDEVATLAMGRTAKENKAPLDLYLEQMSFPADFLKRKGVRPLLWADMAEKLPDEKLLEIKGNFDFVLWGGNDLEKRFRRFASLSCPVWGAPCFKGADGNSSDLPDIPAREKIIEKYMTNAAVIPLQGLIACGWSRYTTLAPQCDPVEGALDSAVRTGLLFSGRDPGKAEEVLEKMSFKRELTESKTLLQNMSSLRKDAYEKMLRALELSAALEQMEAYDDCKMAFYVVKMLRYMEKFELLKKDFHKHFDRFFPEKVVENYLNERIVPFRKIEKILLEAHAKTGNTLAVDGYKKYFNY